MGGPPGEGDGFAAAAGEWIGPGSLIGSYRVEEQIGRGGMAAVFRARDQRLDRVVALKLLAPELAADEAFRRRFFRESRAAAAVDDPHIIPVHEAGQAGGVLFIAMRYVPGGDLGALVRRNGPLSPDRAAAITSAVASALDAAHGAGLVHRDVKPTNMLLDARPGRPDHVYLSDFGLAKGILSAANLTGSGQFLGTADYSAPEQIQGRPVDGRADQYSLGCAAFEMLTGEPPFRRDHAAAVIWAHMAEPAPALTSRRPDLPPEVDAVVAKALAKEPDGRYATCGDFAEALRAALGLPSYDSGSPSVPQAHRAAAASTEHAGTEPATEEIEPARLAGELADEQPAWPAQETVTVSRPGGRRSTAGAVTDVQGGMPGRAGRRRRAILAASGAAAALATAAGLILLGNGGGTPVHGHHAGHRARTLVAPRCWQPHGSAPAVSARPMTANLPAGPYGLQASPDGRYSFVAIADSIVVLRNTDGVPSAPPVQTIQVAGHAKDEVITSNGRYLLVADGNGAAVIDIRAAEGRRPGAALLGQLASPVRVGQGGASQVALSTGNRFAFVTLQSENEVAVFNLARAISLGFNQADFIRDIPVADPVGVTASPDGRWLYVTSKAAGRVSVIDLSAAESASAKAVVSTAAAGCSPMWVITSPHGRVVWVTARDSNALLGFSASGLRTHPASALIADVQVGESPVGETLVKGGREIVTADSNLTGKATGSVAIADVPRALAGKPALLGLIKSSLMPREVATERSPAGDLLVVTFDDSSRVEVFRISDLP